jgi:hypothetical protein
MSVLLSATLTVSDYPTPPVLKEQFPGDDLP